MEGHAFAIYNQSGFHVVGKGDLPSYRHFALIKIWTDFITGRNNVQSFEWSALEGSDVLVHHGGQPLTMFKFACKSGDRHQNKYH